MRIENLNSTNKVEEKNESGLNKYVLNGVFSEFTENFLKSCKVINDGNGVREFYKDGKLILRDRFRGILEDNSIDETEYDNSVFFAIENQDNTGVIIGLRS